MTYRPPLAEIAFALEHLAELPMLADLPGLQDADLATTVGALEEAARFVSDVISPLGPVGDAAGCTLTDGSVTTPPGTPEAYRRFVEAGWGAISFPTEFGGGGFPWVATTAVQEMLSSASMGFALCPMLTQGAVELLLHHGSDEQRATYLPKLVTGEWTGTMNLTEPDAGSDVGALRTRAVPHADGSYRISGTKIFITYGDHDLAENIVHLVLARTPDSPAGTRGISVFVVPKFLVGADGSVGARNAVVCSKLEHKIGIHASPTCVLEFEDAVGFLIGEECTGMRSMFTMMNNARLSVALEGLAVAEAAYQLARDYAHERVQGRATGAGGREAVPIAAHPDVRLMLATMKTQIDAMRGLLYFDAALVDRAGSSPDEAARRAAADLASLLTPVGKAWCTDLGVELTSIGVQVHGGMGFIEETGAGRLWRDSRIAPIYEGTNGIQAIDLVLRKLPLGGGAVVGGLLDRVEAEAGPTSEVAMVRLATTTLLAHLSAGRVDEALAGATPYLRMLGLVLGDWSVQRAATAARTLLGQHPSDPFLHERIAVAAFYRTRILPAVAGLAPSVTAGAADLFALAL